MEVSEAKLRLLDWANKSDAAKADSPFSLVPALGGAAAGLFLGRFLLPGGKKGERSGSSLLNGALSIASIVRIAKWVLPIVLKKI